MSAYGFQTVLAQLIRFPTDSLENIEERLGHPELTPLEQNQLRRMAQDPLVRKFGYKMRFCRQRDATEIMRLSKDFIDPSALDTMYQEYFEPTRTTSDLVLLGVQFLEFALHDERCRKLIHQGEPFLENLISYDQARAFIVRQVIPVEDASLPSGSRLRHTAFLIKDFRYDIPSIDRLKVKDPKSRAKPDPKALKLIFLRCEEAPFFRIFQIDDSIQRFLEIQKNAPESWCEPLPIAFPAMVSVGLCRKEV